MPPDAPSVSARIAVIDDDPGVLALLRHTLTDAGYTVEAYVDSAVGIQAVLESPPALLLTDLTMPGPSGLDVIAAVREALPDPQLPIVVLSALGDEEVILQCFALGATDYLVKPPAEGQLKAKIAQLLARAAKQRPHDTADITAEFAENPDALVGRMFAGHHIHRKIGEGGMGVVFEATSPDGRAVALKVLAPRYAKDRKFLKRFFREANNLKLVHHENVAQFYEIGHENLVYFISMEYVDGPPLDDFLVLGDLMTELAVVELLIQIARALGALHECGIIHRDIKPGNVLIGKDGTVKLVDFGLAKRADDERLTQTNVFFGTATYMSPEQVRGSEVDHRSDLYALGVLYYYLATGDVPFDNEDVYAVLFQHVNEKPQEPQERNPRLSNTGNFTILKLLAKDPDNRYATAAEVIAELEAHATVLRAGHADTELGFLAPDTAPIDAP